MTKYTTISIPEELHKKIAKIIAGTDFTSVAEFTKFLLRTITTGGTFSSDIDEKDVKLVRKRLKELGYI